MWCGWRFEEFTNPGDFECVSEGDKDHAEAPVLDPHYIELRERRISRSVLDGIPHTWVPRSTPPPISAGLGQASESEAAFFAQHSGIPAAELTSEAVEVAAEKVVRDIAAGNVLRYLMWLIGSEIDPANAAAQQATVNMLFRIRDEFGLLNPTQAGLLLEPNSASPVAVIDEAHARSVVVRFTLGDLHLYPGFQFTDGRPYAVIARLRGG